MSLAAASLAAALLAAEPVAAEDVGRDVGRILAQERYMFCAEDNDFVPSFEDRRWCEIPAATQNGRCRGYAEVCARRSPLDELGWDIDESSTGESGTGGEEKPKKKPGDANQGAYEEREQFELPNLGGFARILMWLLIIGGVLAVVYVIAKNLVRDNDPDEPELDLEPDAGESLIAARAAAMRVVETDVQRLLARAEQAAARGDYEAAINDVYAALLRRLEGEQLISVEHWKTNGDYLGELRSQAATRPRSASLPDEVREIVREVEQIQFGAAAPEQNRYFNIRTKVLAVVGRAALGFAILLGGATLLGCPLFEDEDPNALPNSAALAGLGTGPADQRAIGELLLVHDIEARHRTRSIEELTGGDKAIVLLEDVELLEEDWDTLIRWVEDEGGKLIVATGEDFPRELKVDYQPIEPVTELEAGADYYFYSRFEMVAPAGRVLTSRGFDSEVLVRRAEPLLEEWVFDGSTLEEGSPYVIRRRLGSEGGEVIVFAEPDLWTNVGVSVADNAALLVNLLRTSEITEVEFVDRYTGAGPDDPFESMGNARLGGLFLQILLFLALLYAAVGIPFARLRDPQRELRRSFVEHVRTLGQRYAQARASRYVAGIYSAWALDRLRERLLAKSGGLLPLAQAISARTGRDEASIMQVLIAAHELRDSSEHSTRGSADDLELMRRLAELLDETGGRR